MKKQYLVKTKPSGLALFILISTMVGQTAANDLSNAAETALVGDTTASTKCSFVLVRRYITRRPAQSPSRSLFTIVNSFALQVAE